ncbi:MAG: ABC transporter permease [Candidatus Thermoplasmatota archaeon]|nr:ABC transporter permease [Candidatus Thermoplasmatota archaeon]
MKGKLRQIWIFLKSHFKNRVRTKKFLVWVVITPMLLIGFLNLIGGEDDIRADVAVLDRDGTTISAFAMAALRSEDRLDIHEVEGLDEGIDLLREGEVEAFLVIPENFSEDFRRIKDKFLFNIEKNIENITDDMDNETVSDELRESYEIEGYPLSDDENISITAEKKGKKWNLYDENKRYNHEIKKENEELNIYDNNSGDYETIKIDVYHVSGEQEDLIETVLKGVTADINEFILGDDMKKPVELVSRPRDLREKEWSFSDLLLPGGIMIVILQSGFFASSDNASVLTEAMLDKRLRISPVPRIYSISGMVLMDALFTTIAGLIALSVGLILFEIALPLMSVLGFIPIIFISSLIFSYMGCCIGKLSSDRASTQGLSSMMVFPLIFFSQAYLFSMMFPEYVIIISRMLPIYPAADMMKQLLFYSPSISYYGFKIGQSFVWLVVVFIIFLYFYRE